MGLLDKLTFTSAKRTAAPASADPTMRLREKLIAAIDAQKQLVEADMSGTTLSLKVKKYVGTGDDRKQVEQDKRIRRWYWHSAGEWHTEIRYGTSVLSLGKHTTIGAGPELKGLLDVYEIVKEATKSGELDKVLAVAGVRKRKGMPVPEAIKEPEPANRNVEPVVVAPRFKAPRKAATR